MNKEIEDILAISGKYITYAERNYVLDYITKLQNQLEEKIYLYNKLDTESKYVVTNLQEENKILKELNVCVGCNNNPDYKSRNEKAIEYIKERYDYILKGDFLDHDEQVERRQITYLLNILQGEDKDVKDKR